MVEPLLTYPPLSFAAWMHTETPHQRATAAQAHEMAASRRHRLHPPARGSEPDPHQHLWAVPGLSSLLPPWAALAPLPPDPEACDTQVSSRYREFFFFTAFVRRNHYFPINIYFYLVPGHVASPRAAGWAQRLQAPHYQCQPLPRASLGGHRSLWEVLEDWGWGGSCRCLALAAHP